MQDERVIDVLTEDLDEEVLEKMPEWFRILRNASCAKIKWLAKFS